MTNDFSGAMTSAQSKQFTAPDGAVPAAHAALQVAVAAHPLAEEQGLAVGEVAAPMTGVIGPLPADEEGLRIGAVTGAAAVPSADGAAVGGAEEAGGPAPAT